MACQKACKQGRDDIIVKVKLQSPHKYKTYCKPCTPVNFAFSRAWAAFLQHMIIMIMTELPLIAGWQLHVPGWQVQGISFLFN